jgi:hypothetical protein
MTYDTFTQSAIDHSPIEYSIVLEAIALLAASGNPVARVYDGGEWVRTPSTASAIEAVFSVDFSTLLTTSGQFVSIALGNEWYCLNDYSASLESTLAPLSSRIDRSI